MPERRKRGRGSFAIHKITIIAMTSINGLDYQILGDLTLKDS